MRNPLRLFVGYSLYEDTANPAIPKWLRICMWIDLAAFSGAVAGAVLLHIGPTAGVGYKIWLWCGGATAVMAWAVTTGVVLPIMRRTAQATGKRTLVGQFGTLFLRAFLFVMLPCLLLTLAAIAWSVLTHHITLQ